MRKFTAIRLLLVATLCAAGADADELRLSSPADWQTWAIPKGTLEIADDGSISLAWMRRNINAVADAAEFSHSEGKKQVFGGIRTVNSNPQDAANIMDQDPSTWWQPSADDPLDDWWIEIDLGRPVLARKLRFVFPDTPDAKPFRNFTTYISNGVDTRYGVTYHPVAVTTTPNVERVFEVDLKRIEFGLASGEHLIEQDTLDFNLIHHVRLVPTEKNIGAALAEIEVDALGDNLAIGTVERGGAVRAGRSEDKVGMIFDGDVNTNWRLAVGGDQAKEGNLRTYVEDGDWFEWDLGATFWVDHLSHLDLTVGGGEGSRGSHGHGAKLFILTTSDGTPASGLTSDRIRSNFDYQELSDVFNDRFPNQQSYHFAFPLRKIRHIFYHRSGIPTRLQIRQSVFEYILHGEGHVAATEMVSDFIDLGAMKSVRKLSWDADLPAGTQIEIRSQTGNTFELQKKYYHKNGTELDSARFGKLPKSVRGRIDTLKLKGPDWSGWSQPYAFPEEAFLSPTPRQFLQLQIQLANDDPQLTPVLRSLTLAFDDPLVSGGIAARILPREVGLDSLQRFTYLLQPTSTRRDQGFDEVFIQVPGAVQEVGVRVGGQSVQPRDVELTDGLLRVGLPERVRQDSVEVLFTAQVTTNATLFEAWAGDSQQNVRQGVEPLEPRSMIVFVPDVTGDSLLRNVQVTPVVTPNGDGVNDEAQINFIVVQVEDNPNVDIYDLTGSHLRTLDLDVTGFAWDGRDDAGAVLPPGVYICRIQMEADSGDQSVYRTISLAY